MAKWQEVFELIRHGSDAYMIMSALRVKPYRMLELLNGRRLAQQLEIVEILTARLAYHVAAKYFQDMVGCLASVACSDAPPETVRKACAGVIRLARQAEKMRARSAAFAADMREGRPARRADRGRDDRDTHGQDARGTHGQDARATRGREDGDTHGRDARATAGGCPLMDAGCAQESAGCAREFAGCGRAEGGESFQNFPNLSVCAQAKTEAKPCRLQELEQQVHDIVQQRAKQRQPRRGRACKPNPRCRRERQPELLANPPGLDEASRLACARFDDATEEVSRGPVDGSQEPVAGSMEPATGDQEPAAVTRELDTGCRQPAPAPLVTPPDREAEPSGQEVQPIERMDNELCKDAAPAGAGAARGKEIHVGAATGYKPVPPTPATRDGTAQPPVNARSVVVLPPAGAYHAGPDAESRSAAILSGPARKETDQSWPMSQRAPT